MTSQKSSHSAAAEGAAPKAPARARGRARVARLLEAASAEFAEKGYGAATMTAIAARAESSIGSLYQFFPTKEQIAAALMEQYTSALVDALDALRALASAGDAAALAARLTALFGQFRAAHPAFVVLVDAADLALPSAQALRLRIRGSIETLIAALAPGLPAAALAVRAAVVQHLMKTAVAMRFDASIDDREAALRDLEHLMLHYLGDCTQNGR